MKQFTRWYFALPVLLLVGVGCNTVQPLSPVPTTTPKVLADWKTITPGGVISLKIPPNCTAEGAAGSTYVVCPTAENPTPIPEFVVSSDGTKVRIDLWEGLESPYWDDVISSLKIITPLTRELQINIDK